MIESVNYYDVTGATAREVRASLNREGPISGNDGKRYDAVCRWNVSWKFQYRRGNGSCGIEPASTEVKITITFPRLKTDETTSASLVKAFASFAEKLMLHEKGHAQNAIDTARKIEAGILALRPEPTCDALRNAANDLGHALIKRSEPGGHRLRPAHRARRDPGRAVSPVASRRRWPDLPDSPLARDAGSAE